MLWNQWRFLLKKSENRAVRNYRDPARLVFRNFDEMGLYKVRDVESRIFHTEIINLSIFIFIEFQETLLGMGIAYFVRFWISEVTEKSVSSMRSRFRFEYLYKKSPSGAFIGKGWIILYDFRSLKLQNKPLLLYIQGSYWKLCTE